MLDRTFGIDPDKREDIPAGLRRTGVTGGGGIKDKFFNQMLFEINQDQVIGTAAQLALGDATLKYQPSDQTLRDKDDAIVTLVALNRIYITGLDTLTADFDLSAYNKLQVVSDPSITLGNSSYNLKFGDGCELRIIVATRANITIGTGCFGFIDAGLLISGDLELNNDFNITGDINQTGDIIQTGDVVQNGKRYARGENAYQSISGVTQWNVGSFAAGTTYNFIPLSDLESGTYLVSMYGNAPRVDFRSFGILFLAKTSVVGQVLTILASQYVTMAVNATWITIYNGVSTTSGMEGKLFKISQIG